MPVEKPVWENKWGPNTVISVLGFTFLIIGGLIAWGYVVAEFRGALATHDIDLARLDKRLTAIEASTRQLDAHELRISAVEVSSRDASAALRAVETSINSLASDMRLTREILERLERGQSPVRSPP